MSETKGSILFKLQENDVVPFVEQSIVTIADGTNDISLTAPLHANKILYVLDATLNITLPEATGSGNTYIIVQGIDATSSTIVTADTTNCHFEGALLGAQSDADGTAALWMSDGGFDTITYNGTTTGGEIGSFVKVTDVATDVWLLEGTIKQSGVEATPLSNA